MLGLKLPLPLLLGVLLLLLLALHQVQPAPTTVKPAELQEENDLQPKVNSMKC